MSRYADLQPVGMGAFGLVWYVMLFLLYVKQPCLPTFGAIPKCDILTYGISYLQLGQGPTHRTSRCGEEDHEAFQHARVSQADLSRAKAVEAFATRECA